MRIAPWDPDPNLLVHGEETGCRRKIVSRSRNDVARLRLSICLPVRLTCDFLSLRERIEVRVIDMRGQSHHTLPHQVPRGKGTLILTFSLREKELPLVEGEDKGEGQWMPFL